jgi:hypothetical protein
MASQIFLFNDIDAASPGSGLGGFFWHGYGLVGGGSSMLCAGALSGFADLWNL